MAGVAVLEVRRLNPLKVLVFEYGMFPAVTPTDQFCFLPLERKFIACSLFCLNCFLSAARSFRIFSSAFSFDGCSACSPVRVSTGCATISASGTGSVTFSSAAMTGFWTASSTLAARGRGSLTFASCPASGSETGSTGVTTGCTASSICCWAIRLSLLNLSASGEDQNHRVNEETASTNTAAAAACHFRHIGITLGVSSSDSSCSHIPAGSGSE